MDGIHVQGNARLGPTLRRTLFAQGKKKGGLLAAAVISYLLVLSCITSLT